jgi:DNA topoisomerase-3
VEEESKPSTQLSPLLFDLTSLQREANGRFGFSARTTLQLAQALYEKHKVLTYPRTDARALPEDYVGHGAWNPRRACRMNTRLCQPDRQAGLGQAQQAHLQQRQDFRPLRHHPHRHGTQESVGTAEAKIYDLVTRRFLAVFYPAAEYRITTRITRVEGEAFKTEGKVLVNPGWLAVYGKEAAVSEEEGGAPQLVVVEPGETLYRRNPAQGPGHQAAGTLQRSHPAVGHGRRRQDGGRRGAARRHGRPRPRHPGHPRPDHREPDRRKLHACATARS